MTAPPDARKALLTLPDAVAMTMGLVIGAGIFKTPSLVAGALGTAPAVLGAWALGGVLSLVGALCYAELASTYPNLGGDYYFLGRAFHRLFAFLFGWARVSVIQTGSIAVQAYVVGEYATTLLPLGEHSVAIYAALAVALISGLNLLGLRQGKLLQNLFVLCVLVGVSALVATGLGFAPPPPPSVAPPGEPALGRAMIFVLFTFGGWNEAAYLATELRDGPRAVPRALFWGIGLTSAVYLVINLAFVRGLGVAGMAGSDAVAAALMRRTWGEPGGAVVSVLIILAVLSTINGCVITGARTICAMGRDYRRLEVFGRYEEGSRTPVAALLIQAAVALGLIGLGAYTYEGFSTLVDYTAPVFWLFFLLVGASLLVLRGRDPGRPRPFRVPAYPLLPLLFCATAAFMLYSSVAYAGLGSLVGIGVLLAGLPLFWLCRAGGETACPVEPFPSTGDPG